uniref:Uncharacterized protein n=1 Tax=Caenorhabditis japonica TaxID=281687 RepID=A0A8R1HL66_CAEJA
MKLALIFSISSIFLSCAHVAKRQAANDAFQDVVRQKTRGNQIQQCPCVIHPESRQCISYDSRYIAVNYEEAILSFLDLSKHHALPAPLINSNTFSCTNQECQQCFSLLYNKLSGLGFIPSSYRSSITPLPQNQINPSLCPRYNFPRPATSPAVPPVVPTYLQSLISAGKSYRSTILAGTGVAQTRSGQGSPPSASPVSPLNNQNNNANLNNNNNLNSRNPNWNSNRNPNQNRNQNKNFNDNLRSPSNNQQTRFRTNQNNQNALDNQRMQFRNNQAMRNRFNTQQRANNGFQQNQNFQPQVQRPRQQQFQQPQSQSQFQNPRPFQNFNGVQQHWNAVGNGWSNGWGQQGNRGAFPQATPPVPVHPAVAPAAPQPTPVWSNGGGNGIGGGGHFGGGWGGGGTQARDNNGIGGIFGGFKQRYKRATSPAIIGQRFTINCLSRGDSEDDMLALCGSCWAWRQLPENYFPRIINELSCKPDDYCLSGWGECVQQYRNVDVLRRENGRWVPTVITTSTCCDCRIHAGSEIHSLVVGDKR